MSTTFTYDGKAIFRAEKGKEAELERKHGNGTFTEPIESTLRYHEQLHKWNEPAPPALRICPVCGVLFPQKGKKIYCCTRCANYARKRKELTRKRLSEQQKTNFKPYRGKTGEIYFMTFDRKISYIPAVFCINSALINGWISDRYQWKEEEYIKQQILEVLGSEK